MERVKSIGQKTLKYIKENKLYLFVMIVASIALMVQMKEVVLYADDFSLGIISQGGFKSIWNYFINNYMTWGGGLTCLFATTFLLFRIGVWKAFQCGLIILMVILATKMLTHKDKKNKALVAGFIWLFLYILTILISREIFYWLDGGLAYALTTFQIFAYFYYLYTRLHLKINKKYDKILLPIVAFFAGWSSAQTGPMVVIIPIILLLWQKFVQKEKISKFYYITTIIGIIGFCIFFFAPGNNARMDSAFADYANYNVIEKILYRVDGVYGLLFNFTQYEIMGVPFYLILFMGINALVGLYLFRKEENRGKRILVKIVSIIQIIFSILCLAIALKIPYVDEIANTIMGFENVLHADMEGKLTFKILLPYILTSIVMLSIVIETFLISLKKKDPMLVTTVVVAFLMQGVMVMAPYNPLRTTCYTIIFLWFAIAYLIKMAYSEKISLIIPVIIAIMIYSVPLGFVALISYLLVKNIYENEKLYRGEMVVIIGVLLVMAYYNYSTILNGYKQNHDIYDQNMVRIEEFKKRKENGSDEKELYLLPPADERCGFTPLVGTEWVEDAVKQYFKIDEDVEIKAETAE